MDDEDFDVSKREREKENEGVVIARLTAGPSQSKGSQVEDC